MRKKQDQVPAGISRRAFAKGLTATSWTLASARVAAGPAALPAAARKTVKGTGAELLVEQLTASGVKYIFGNSGHGDAGFYDALVDRPQLRYVMGLHEGPVAAMAFGYALASGEIPYVCVGGIAGMTNILGQMFNAYKTKTGMVCVAYKRELMTSSGRDVFEELVGQEDLAAPLSKWKWIAKRAETIPEVVRRAFKIAQTPPGGPVYLGWNYDLLMEQGVEAEIIAQSAQSVPLDLRASQKDIERAARLLIAAKSPVLLVGDEINRSGAAAETVRLAELLAIPVTTTHYEGLSNFPEAHPLYLGMYSRRLRFPRTQDVVFGLGCRVEAVAGGRESFIAPDADFIDMRVDSREIADIFPTAVPLACNVKQGLLDLIAAVESMLTPAQKSKIQERFEATRTFTAAVRKSQLAVRNSADWNSAPLLQARLSYEIGRLMDRDAYVVVESAETFGIEFDPLHGPYYIASRGGHLGFAVGGAAGVKLAKPNHQVVCMVGDGSFLFGPHGLWTMARFEIPVIVVVFNNQSYNGVKDRSLAELPEGRMSQTGRMVHYYIGAPDVDMVRIAEGFGVKGEKVAAAAEIEPALRRAIASTKEGKPYLIDAHVARSGAWADSPWYPKFSVAKEREKAV